MSVNLGSRRPNMGLFILSLLVALGMWYWALHLYAPQNLGKALASGRPVGNNSDLYARWLGAREALLRGADPYSPEMTNEIQKGFYGRKLNPQSLNDSLASESFAYPLYVVFLLAPTIGIPFSIVAEIFRWILLLCIAGSVPLWMYSLGFQPRWQVWISGMILAVSTIPAIQEYFQQNLAALVIFLLAAATAMMVRNHLIFSGTLLALATVKPDISAIFVFWFLLWVMGDWPKRKRVALSFVASFTILVLAAEAISPRWIEEFLISLREYKAHDLGPSILQVLLPSGIASLLAIALVVVLVFVCWKSRKESAGSERFGFVIAFLASAELVLLPAGAVYNQFLLIPAFILLTLRRDSVLVGQHARGNISNIFASAPMLCQAWQWAAALLLSFTSMFVRLPFLHTWITLPCYTLFTLVPLTFIAIGLSKIQGTAIVQ